MVEIDCHFGPEVKQVLKELDFIARRFPKTVEAGVRSFMGMVNRSIRKTMKDGGGKNVSVQPLSHLRKQLFPDSPFGGKFTENRNALVKVKKINSDAYAAGYITNVEGAYNKWQDGGANPAMSIPEIRRWMYAKLGKQYATDMSDWVRGQLGPIPQRDVIAQEATGWKPKAAEHLRKEIIRLFRKNLKAGKLA